MASEKTVELPRPELSAAKRALIEARLRGQARSSDIIPRASRDGAPLSFAQERLWFLDRLEPGSAAYNIPVVRRLGGAVDPAVLERALGEIVRRHEALRTVFREVDGSPVQVIAPFAGFTLRVDDLSGLSGADREAEVRRRAGEEAGRPFDLAAGPLFRAALLRLGEQDHLLLLTMHHIVSDGWSTEVLFRELSALYAAYREGRESPLPELAVQYVDYAVWQREQLKGEPLERHLSYWREQLAGAPELLELPTDHPRPPVQTHRGASVPVELSRELLERLQALGRGEEATLYMVVLAAFQVLLSKYSGSEDIVVGSPIAGRTRREVEELIGFFVNTLVLRTDLSGNPSFREVLRRAREVTLKAYEHQEVPFEKLVAELQPERSLSHSPLFQVLFALQNAGGGGGAPTGREGNGAGAELEGSGAGAELASAQFDLSMELTATPQGLRGWLTYSTDLFDRGTADRMLGHLQRVLEQVAANADVRLSELELLGDAERAQVLEAWNRTEAEYPSDRCIHELFEVQAARTPDAEAVRFQEESLTYAELNARANRLAHHLRGHGVGHEVRVGVMMERGVEMMVSLIAVLKAGGAYVPLDPGLPAERLAYMLEDSGVPLVLAQAALAAAVPARDGLEVLAVDALAERLAAEPAENPAAGAGPDSLAYVIYTSGSTGRPKGVMNVHRGVVNLLWSMRGTVAMAPADRLLAVTTLAFDISVLELFLPLLSGARVEILDRSAASDPALLRQAIGAGAGTVLQATPATWRLLLDAGWEGGESLRALSGGEALPAELAARLRERVGALWNVYGPTETTIWSTAQHLDAAADVGRGHASIGAPVANTRVYVLDRYLSPAPAGVPGELYIGGAGVARGYLGRPGLSAEKFVPDPFGAEPGARLYRTGDLARWRADGTLEFLARNDHQVKVRGFRIEPGEIEARLAEHAGVREAVVLVREDASGEKRLVAYVAGDGTAGADVLRAHLAERLPEYMVPAAYVRVETLPLTPNGKLDRKALPAPDGDAFAARGYEAPSGKVEEAVAAIWAELLGVERVGRYDHFFELGGHSLLAVRVVSRVRQALGVEVSPRDVFERPVLAHFARGLQGAAQAEATAIVPVERSGPLPLSFAQQRLWFIEQMERVGSTYHIPMGLRLRGELDRGALVRSLDRIVARHEALRTSFPAVDGEPAQHVAPVEESGFRLVEHDLRSSAEAEDELRRLVRDEAGARFDLEHGPLFRGRLVRMAADDHVLLLTMHHIVSDGWSAGVLFRELGALYAAFTRGEPDPLPPLPVQYADYAVWHRRWVEGPVLEAQAQYWTERLAGAPELLELPTDRPRPARQDFTGAAVKVELDEALAASLRTLSQRHGTTLFMTLLAGWAAVLARLSGQDDVVIGTPTANRARAEVEELIGFFVNTLPLRVDVSGAPTVAGLLDRVRSLALEAQRNQDIPFEQVVERVHPTRSLAHSPLFQVLFSWQNAPGGNLQLPGLAVGPLHPAGSGGSPAQVAAKYDLSLTLWEQGARIVGDVTYATALFDRATVERHVDYLRRVLAEMAADDAKPLHRLELLSAAERRTVVEEWNATDFAFPAGACVHELFEAQVERTPGAVAVSFQGMRAPYAGLNAEANRLAHHLRALGVGPEVRVAVCLVRGIETLVALLAVLKAGGGYVPLDPSHPDDRLRYALEDSAPGAVLTWGPLAARFAGAGVPVVDMADRATWAAHPTSNPDRAGVGVGPEHLAYVIYTSGSTGRPKGVLVRHDSYVNLLAVTRAYFDVGPGDVVSAVASSAFDFSLFELVLPLVCGAELRLIPPQKVRDPNALLDDITDVTLLSAVPALMREIVQAERQAPRLARLRATCVAGEAVPADLLAEMSTVLPGVRTHVGYGPTETTIFASMHAVPEDGAVTGYPIGRPMGNMRLYVCDAFFQPQPVGVIGELLIGGMGVGRGYLGRPALTAERFVPDPFSAVPGARLYRSGDRVRWKEDGVVDYLGRTDFQVKVRGFRIELGEIEARLREHPGVRQAVVLAREDAPGKKRLVAYVVGDAASDALKAHLEASLPGYMVPAAYVRMEALPLTSNGKVDRRALPLPDGGSFARRSHEAPRTMTEQVLASIWVELLGVQKVGRRDNFFDLGGQSLLAVRMVARVREALNPAATVDQVFAHPTLYDLAAQLQGGGEWYGTDHAIPIRETGSERPLFVSHDGVGIVFYGQILRPHLDPEIPVYALPGPLNDMGQLTTLDDLVTRLVRMMTEVQPEGPYRVAGWSAGGVFAYAVAERLIRMGQAVEFIGLLDTWHPTRQPEVETPRERQGKVLELLARDSGVPPTTPEALRALNEDTEGMDLPAFIDACKARGLLPESVTVARAEQVDSRIALLKRSVAEYVPPPLPVSATIFSTTDDAGEDPRRGWEDIPGGAPFRVERVPGTHHTMWRKGNVEEVGAVISRAVRASTAAGG
jgi:amino acid adenylation domain-containing protein